MRSTREYIDAYLSDVRGICDAIPRESIERVIDILFEGWQRGACVFTFGNGGSASTASHFAADLANCTVVPGAPRLRTHALVDNTPLVSALTNDAGWENVYLEQLQTHMKPGDIGVGISVHGGAGRDRAGLWSQNLMKALQHVKDNGGLAIGLSGFDGGPMKGLADACIVVPADSTPQVEGFHVVLHHLVTFGLAERIRGHLGVADPGRV